MRTVTDVEFEIQAEVKKPEGERDLARIEALSAEREALMDEERERLRNLGR